MKENTKNLNHKDSLRSEGQNSQELNTNLRREMHRKPSNTLLTTHKNNLSDTRSEIQDTPKYMPKMPMKNLHSNSTASLNNPIFKPIFYLEDMKTERKEEKECHKKYNEESADYYKYWKKKANDYQQENFELRQVNSTLLEQNEILKFKIEKLEKKILALSVAEHPLVDQNKQNYQKLDTYFQLKMEKLIKTISDQEMLIQKQNKKIEELSNNFSENTKLKSVIDNMEERINEIKSSYGGSRNNSDIDPGEKMFEQNRTGKDIKKKCSDHLSIGLNMVEHIGNKNGKNSGSFLNKSKSDWN